jgi:hypothetical protein
LEVEAAVPEYQLFYLTCENTVVQQVDWEFEDDEKALSKARALAHEHMIDVWQHNRRVALVKAD